MEKKAKKVTTKKAEKTVEVKKVEAAADKPATKVASKKSASSKEGFRAQSCQVAKCHREYRAKGYCKFHYKLWRQDKYGTARYKICSDTGCLKPMATTRHGYCEDHYQNYYVKGLETAK